MIILSEQFGNYSQKKYTDDISAFKHLLTAENYIKYFRTKRNDNFCYKIVQNETKNYSFETSYYIGTDWVVENKLPIYIHPKVNKNKQELNYIKMLSSALMANENVEHLQYLYEIDFKKPMIEIDQSIDLLSPLLVVQFLHLLKKIVKKGLKKSYYQVESNLKSKVKGKILIHETIKRNHFHNKKTATVCRYEVFGYDTIENRILKKALRFVVRILDTIKGIDIHELYAIYNYIQPAFIPVNENVNIDDLKQCKTNPVYKEYEQAILLSKIILKKYGYTISKVENKTIKTPPFWIDMSKLFELYVFAKLKEKYSFKGEVKYHKNFFYRELDYILNSKCGKYKMIIDAKYKPQYANKHLSIEDIRQVITYSRMKGVYNELGVDVTKSIDCLIIYPDQEINKNNFQGVDFTSNHLKIKNYEGLYKVGITLPSIEVNNELVNKN